jgi:hypothetical protein
MHHCSSRVEENFPKNVNRSLCSIIITEMGLIYI